VRAFLEYLLLFLVLGFDFVFVFDALGEPPPWSLLGLPPGLLLLPLSGLGGLLGFGALLGLVPVPLPQPLPVLGLGLAALPLLGLGALSLL
jgi:hypothetical protein